MYSESGQISTSPSPARADYAAKETLKFYLQNLRQMPVTAIKNQVEFLNRFSAYVATKDIEVIQNAGKILDAAIDALERQEARSQLAGDKLPHRTPTLEFLINVVVHNPEVFGHGDKAIYLRAKPALVRFATMLRKYLLRHAHSTTDTRLVSFELLALGFVAKIMCAQEEQLPVDGDLFCYFVTDAGLDALGALVSNKGEFTTYATQGACAIIAQIGLHYYQHINQNELVAKKIFEHTCVSKMFLDNILQSADVLYIYMPDYIQSETQRNFVFVLGNINQFFECVQTLVFSDQSINVAAPIARICFVRCAMSMMLALVRASCRASFEQLEEMHRKMCEKSFFVRCVRRIMQDFSDYSPLLLVGHGEFLHEILRYYCDVRVDRESTALISELEESLRGLGVNFDSARSRQRAREKISRTCAWCHKSQASFQPTGHVLKACSVCKAKYYCSAECQRADWPDHKKTCKPPPADAKATQQEDATRKQDDDTNKKKQINTKSRGISCTLNTHTQRAYFCEAGSFGLITDIAMRVAGNPIHRIYMNHSSPSTGDGHESLAWFMRYKTKPNSPTCSAMQIQKTTDKIVANKSLMIITCPKRNMSNIGLCGYLATKVSETARRAEQQRRQAHNVHSNLEKPLWLNKTKRKQLIC